MQCDSKKNAVKGREVLDGVRGMLLVRSGGNVINPYAFAGNISKGRASFLLCAEMVRKRAFVGLGSVRVVLVVCRLWHRFGTVGVVLVLSPSHVAEWPCATGGTWGCLLCLVWHSVYFLSR